MVIVLITSLAFGAGIARISGHVRDMLQPQSIDGPAKWVSFSAKFQRIDPNGTTVGQLYRTTDGSTRHESARKGETVSLIAIKNIPERTFYMWHDFSGWESHPMDLPPQGWLPLQSRSLDVGLETFGERIEGYEVIKSIDPSGFIGYRAPELNFFTLQIAMCVGKPATSCGISYSQVVLGDVAPELFKPPAGENVIRKADAGGIVAKARQ